MEKRRLWIFAVIGLLTVALAAGAWIAGTRLRSGGQAIQPAAASAQASPTPEADPTAATCKPLWEMNATATKAFADYGLDRAARRKATADADKLSQLAGRYTKLADTAPQAMQLHLLNIAEGLLKISREAAGGPAADYDKASISTAWEALRAACAPHLSPGAATQP